MKMKSKFFCEKHGDLEVEVPPHLILSFKSRLQFPEQAESYLQENLHCPVCANQDKIERLRAQSGIKERFLSCNIDKVLDEKKKRTGKNFIKDFVEKTKQGQCMIFCGTKGTGKTYLASAITNCLINDHLVEVIYINMAQLMQEFKETFSQKNEKYYRQIMDKYSQLPLLIVDEVGVGFKTEAERNIFFELIDNRYSSFKSTILISNYSIKQLEQDDLVDSRAIDRLRECECEVLIFTGESLRGRKINLA